MNQSTAEISFPEIITDNIVNLDEFDLIDTLVRISNTGFEDHAVSTIPLLNASRTNLMMAAVQRWFSIQMAKAGYPTVDKSVFAMKRSYLIEWDKENVWIEDDVVGEVTGPFAKRQRWVTGRLLISHDPRNRWAQDKLRLLERPATVKRYGRNYDIQLLAEFPGKPPERLNEITRNVTAQAFDVMAKLMRMPGIVATVLNESPSYSFRQLDDFAPVRCWWVPRQEHISVSCTPTPAKTDPVMTISVMGVAIYVGKWEPSEEDPRTAIVDDFIVK